MEKVRRINYKSDFVLRERFRNGQGDVVSLPEVDFTLRYWVRSGRVFEASRVGGEYINCVPDGDALLVMLKDHNLGEGALKHELRLSLDNALFADGVQNVYYPECLNIELWQWKSDSEGVTECDTVAAYTRGKAFTYADFTPEQLAALKGDPFTFEDFTPAQITDLRRPADDAAEAARKTVGELVSKSEQATNDATAATKACNDATATNKAATKASEQATVESRKATAAAQGAAQTVEEKIAKLDELLALAEEASRNAPTALRVSYPKRVTLGNGVAQYVCAVVKPDHVRQNVLYLSDGSACEVEPSGVIVAKQPGTSRVHVIPTAGTELYETISIEVVAPAMRVAGSGLRLDADGNIRLT